LKQLSRDPNAAERARRAEKKADAEAGLRVLDSAGPPAPTAGSTGGGGGGFKKSGFKSSFTAVKGPAAPTAAARKNVLGDEDEDEDDSNKSYSRSTGQTTPAGRSRSRREDQGRTDVESDTDDDYGREDTDEAYYDPRKPTDCFTGCPGAKSMAIT
jgi:hypothetical protein